MLLYPECQLSAPVVEGAVDIAADITVVVEEVVEAEGKMAVAPAVVVRTVAGNPM